MKTNNNLSFSAPKTSNNNCSCESTVKSSTRMSVPQLRSLDRSTAKPLRPIFLQVLVNLAEPAQISTTSNSSMENSEKRSGEEALDC